MTKEQHFPLEKIDVMGQKDLILPAVVKLLQVNEELSNKYHQMKVGGEIAAHRQGEMEWRDLEATAIKTLITPIWKEYKNRRTDYNVLSNSKDVKVERAIILGHNALSGAFRPDVKDSFVLGHNALLGFSVFRDCTPQQASISIQAGEASYRVSRLDKIMKKLDRRTEAYTEADRERQRQEEKLRTALRLFDAQIPKGKKEWASNYFENVRPDIFKNFTQYRQYAVAAYEVQTILDHLSIGGAYNIRVDNSVVFGWNALSEVIRGEVRDSIIGGYNALSGANLHVVNSYVVSHYNGTQYIEDAYIGDPEWESVDLTTALSRATSLMRGREEDYP